MVVRTGTLLLEEGLVVVIKLLVGLLGRLIHADLWLVHDCAAIVRRGEEVRGCLSGCLSSGGAHLEGLGLAACSAVLVAFFLQNRGK